jgi:SAM-dependent methyltransferase
LSAYFDGLAADYQAHRPHYPAAILQSLKTFAAPLPGRRIVDVGAGTGILLRQLHETFGEGFAYVGVEPGRDMRETARRATPAESISFVEATAEALPFADDSVALLSVAQALHWFDRERFFGEAKRVLAAGGTLAVLYNQRDTASALNADYERFTAAFNARSEADASDGRRRGGLGGVLLRDGTFRREIAAAFGDAGEFQHRWERAMTAEVFVGMARSTTQMQNAIQALGANDALARLRELIGRHTKGAGTMTVPYITTLIAAKRQG